MPRGLRCWRWCAGCTAAPCCAAARFGKRGALASSRTASPDARHQRLPPPLPGTLCREPPSKQREILDAGHGGGAGADRLRTESGCRPHRRGERPGPCRSHLSGGAGPARPGLRRPPGVRSRARGSRPVGTGAGPCGERLRGPLPSPSCRPAPTRCNRSRWTGCWAPRRRRTSRWRPHRWSWTSPTTPGSAESYLRG